MSRNISFYSKNAQVLSEQYDSVPFESVHKDWLNEIPKEGFVLDVGAGSGRDARYLAAKGLSVVAAEPASGIRELAKQYNVDSERNSNEGVKENPNSAPAVHWLADSLPDLKSIFALQTKFDLILLSAVWMHIVPSQRERCIRKLSALLKPNGKIIISLRHGQSGDERVMHPVSADELAKLASQFGLAFKRLSKDRNQDELGRGDVSWETVLLQLPDDGTGAFPLIRNIAVNDNKSSTYKLALLRSLLRIAEGHPGAVIEQTDNHVALPMGLVALYWMKLFKPLVDQSQMQQNSGTKTGLGFIKPDGWGQLTYLSVNDFYIGAHFQSSKIAGPLYKALKDITSTIKNMPVKYTTLPGTNQPVFSVETKRTSQPKSALILNNDFLGSLGTLYVPIHIWESLARYSVWIEPTLINEWANLMSGFQNNKAQGFTKLDYLKALAWDDPARTTARVRKRVDDILSKDDVACCWSGRSIKSKPFAIDHAFPFARWPNNDLWNLLPTKASINANKSDKLPTRHKVSTSRDFITHWWQQAWQQNQEEFFTQANLALPSLSSNNRSFDDVFEAFSLQRDRIKDLQQLADWG